MTPSPSRKALIDPRAALPAVGALLERKDVRDLVDEASKPLVLDALHAALEAFREALAPGVEPPSEEAVVDAARDELLRVELDRLRPVVNASGVVLHTGLGRAVLPQRAVDALAGMNRCCNLQVDLETGLRGKRNARTEELLCRLTGAEAALVVANNAAATLLILSGLAAGGEVVVSRGQLIEIGGSFRLPDCIHQSGARLVEVGTTNKTHLRDYAQALGDETAAVLRCNPSNYRVVGFSKSVSTAELATLKSRRDFVLIDDLGCGALVDLERYGLPHEPTVRDSVAAGADVVCFSGDKLIGGPQAGIVVGRRDVIQRLKKHPLVRMLRVGKLTDVALEQTLRLFLDPETLEETNPTIRMLAMKPERVRRRARALKRRIDRLGLPFETEVLDVDSVSGGGALPATPIPSAAVALRADCLSAVELSRRLRKGDPPVVARIEEDRVLLDLRTFLDGDDRRVAESLEGIAASFGRTPR